MKKVVFFALMLYVRSPIEIGELVAEMTYGPERKSFRSEKIRIEMGKLTKKERYGDGGMRSMKSDVTRKKFITRKFLLSLFRKLPMK